ncbi:MAG: caspase family protein [Chloroflexi bacterium]|nr:caspase family protein [Chloroflexota bacterium]
MAIGLAIHIGLNQVDPEHYKDENGEPWNGSLTGCEFDAQDLLALSESQGFSSQLLIGPLATVENVKEAILQTAESLMPADFLLVTFSGYGGQVPNRFSELNSQSQTWCLYDRQFVLNELNALWMEFRVGVRILVLSDTCHNDTVARRPMFDSVNKVGGPAARLLPDSVQMTTYSRNQREYDDILKNYPEVDQEQVHASVIVISGCQDNQVSFDGSRNGLFTAAMLRIWDNGNFRGSLIQFWRYIIDQMPMYQSPNLFRIGVPNPEFEQQGPFSLEALEESVSLTSEEEVVEESALEPASEPIQEQPLPEEQPTVQEAVESKPSEPLTAPRPEPPLAPQEEAPAAKPSANWVHTAPRTAYNEPPASPIHPTPKAAPSEPPVSPAHVASRAAYSEPPMRQAPATRIIRPQKQEAAPLPPDKTNQIRLDNEWASYMSTGFNNMQEMFRNTLKAYMRSYHITLAMYIILFVVALLFFVVAVILGLTTERIGASLAFGALSVATFLVFFMLRPAQALEENLEFISMLGVSFNNYWARLMHLQNAETMQADIKAAADDYNAALAQLIAKRKRSQAGNPLESVFRKSEPANESSAAAE